MGGTFSDLCLGRDPKGPRRIAELTSEEAYMLKKQQDLKLFVYSCKDVEQAFLTSLHFRSINENEFVETLVKMKLLKADSPTDTLAWLNFYSRLRIQEKLQGSDSKKMQFDLTSVMISLYFLTSSKA